MARLLKKYDGYKYDWWKFWKLVAVLTVLVFLIFRFVIGFSSVKGYSMLPTFSDGDKVIYSRISNDFRPGDIVSVRVPEGEYYIKRVIAVEGDQVNIVGGTLYINKEKVSEEYIQGVTEARAGPVKYPYTVGHGYVFVMGDNREVSMDSRSFGAVNVSQIKGKVIFGF